MTMITPDGTRINDLAGMHFWLRAFEADGAPNVIDLWVPLTWAQALGLIDAMVHCTKESALLATSGNGNLSVVQDGPTSEAPFVIADPHARKDVSDVDRWLQGVYWGNVVSANHIEALGRLDGVLATGACAVRELMTESENPLVYLQASERIDLCSLEDMTRLHAFLQPVLPERFRDPVLAERVMRQALAAAKPDN